MKATPKKANLCGLSAVELMGRADVSLEPRNFELFYLYKSGVNEALNNALERLLDGGARVVQFELDNLYETYVAADGQGVEFASLGDRLNDQINEAIGLVQEAAEATSSFGGSLNEAGSQLGDLSDPKTIAFALSSLFQATENMGRSSLELNRRLTASSEKVEQLQADLAQVRQESQTDALTGIGNRRFFDSVLQTEISRARRQKISLCLCMLDLDHFKKLNDTHGHVTGDAALRLVASLLMQGVREYDVVARYGGEEFAIILSNTSVDTATVVVGRIRKSMAEKQLVRRQTGENIGVVTASFGIAQMTDDDSAETLIERADRCLYAAKRAGRNRIETDALKKDEVASARSNSFPVPAA